MAYNLQQPHLLSSPISKIFGALFFTFLVLAPALTFAQPPALESASTGGIAALDQALARLSTHERLLVIAAHPDDEDTRVLTHVARGRGGEAAYLSLSRGDGGQNLIGPELGIGLGLLRSRELQAAREIDGARQFFTRAYDFGYTRSIGETFERWPRKILLEDAVRVIRRFKPQVIVAVFPPDERAGHGQHQASGIIAREAFAAAGDAKSFPSLADDALHPWTPENFFRSAWFDPDAATHQVPLGQIEPFSGLSIYQISSLSRSQHRCQDMGRELPLGDTNASLALEQGGPDAHENDDNLFAGVDTRLQAMADPLPDGTYKRSIVARLGRIEALAKRMRAELVPSRPQASLAPLLEVVRLLRTTQRNLLEEGLSEGGHVDPAARRQVLDLVEEKLDIAQEAVAIAANILADAITDKEITAPGTNLEVRSIFWNAGDTGRTGTVLEDFAVRVESPDGWKEVSRTPPPEERSFFAAAVTDEQILTLEIPADADATIPYFLRDELDGDIYSWEKAAPALRGEPFQPPPLTLVFSFKLDRTPIELRREAVQRTRDQALGEVRRPLRVVPKLEVEIEPRLLVWPIGERASERLQIAVTSHSEEALKARVAITPPEGWPAVEPIEIELAPNGRAVTEVTVHAPADLAPGRSSLTVAAIAEDGQRFEHAWPLVDYEHIRPVARPQAARVEVSAESIALPQLDRVGYIRGASDRMPEALLQVGVPLEILDDTTLRDADLSVYDVIVVGSRAYESNPVLGRVNQRLLDYARGGGTLVVQYQQYQFVRGGYAPFPFEIRRPHDRVTDEKAPVTILEPEHPIFTTPNLLGDADWDGWVQERGLYFAGGIVDEAYTPLLSMFDPFGSDDEEKQGALHVAPLGEGHYIYTGLAFFRQLPAGVPGAYRLFANLLAFGQETSPESNF